MAGQEVNGGQVYAQANSDAASIKDSLSKAGPAETLERLTEISNDVTNNKWSDDYKRMYFNVLSQNLKKDNVLPELALNFIDKEAPKNDAGEIRKDPAKIGDKNNLSAAFTATLSGKPVDTLRNALFREAMNNFDKYANAVNDGDTSRITPADIKQLLSKQPKRKP